MSAGADDRAHPDRAHSDQASSGSAGAAGADARRLRLVRHPEAAEVARRRARVLAALRAWLDGRGLVEADVPPLQPVAGQEPHLSPPRVTLDGLPGPLFLQTSPELALKRLVCAGLPAVYALGPAFRGGREELSRRHQPQFAMLEWYRPGERVDDLIQDVTALVGVAAAALEVDSPVAFRVADVAAACAEFTGVHLDPLLDGRLEDFAAELTAAGVPGGRAEDGVSSLFNRLVVARLEPALERLGGLVLLHGYPAACAALARLDPDDPRKALRVEAYLGGVELANGYVELTDAAELRARWAAEGAERPSPGGARSEPDPPPVDSRLLAEMALAPPPATVGMALGVDRLMAALLGHDGLDDVLPFRLELH